MTTAEYIKENEAYITNENSLAALEQLTPEEWDAVRESADDTGWEAPGLDCEIAITAETLDEYDHSRANHWSEPGAREEATYNEMASRLYNGLQLFKGQRRRDICVINSGDRRIVLSY